MRCLPIQSPLRLLLQPERSDGSACVLAQEGQLLVQLEDTQQQPVFAWKGPLSSLPTTSSGLRLEIPVQLETPGRHRLHLRWTCGAAQSERLRTLSVLATAPTPAFEALKKRLRAQLKGASGEVRALRYQQALVEQRLPEARLWLWRRWVRALLDVGQGAQAETAALSWSQEARQEGRSAEHVWALSMAQEAARLQEALPRARGYLQQARGLAQEQGVPEALPELWYNEAYVLDQLGEPLPALEACTAALTAAQQQAEAVYDEASRLLELDLLQGLGQHHRVAQKLKRWLEQPPSSVYSAGTLAWLVARAVEAGIPPKQDTAQSLQAAELMLLQALASPEAQQNLTARAHTLANLGLVRLLLGDLTQTKTRLQQAQHVAPPGDLELQLFLRALEVRMHLAEGTPLALRQAQQLAEQLEQKGQQQRQSGDAGDGAYFQGEVANRLGDPAAALMHYARALTH